MNRKGILLSFFLAFLLFSPPQGNAQTATDPATPQKTTIRETQQNKRTDIKERVQETRDTFKEKREALQDEVRIKREDAMGQFKKAREEFKERLASITAEKKRLIVERIDEKMAAINKKRTDHMVTVLEKLNEILKRIEDKANAAKGQGVDTAAADAAIQAAHDAITAASAAVSTQAGKDYIITIGDETGIKNSVGQTMSGVQKDLRNAHKLVIDAKQAVMKAAKELAKTVGRNKTKEHTASGEAE